MNCKKCNNPISNDTKFCAKCGEKVISESKPVSEQKTGKKSALTSIVSVVVFILAFAVVRYLTQQTISPSTNSSSQSVAELATEAVRQVKASTTFPNKLDAATTWVDITAEQNAIRYHYVLAGIDTSSLSNAYLKNYLGSSICQNKDTRNLLDRGVGMEYSYAVENTAQSYFVSFTKADCSQ
jgi:hypothetical protein